MCVCVCVRVRACVCVCVCGHGGCSAIVAWTPQAAADAHSTLSGVR